jgi:hypothetical protein
VLPRALRPGLVLAAESALGITAGLQDRVIQTYEGVVYMARPPRCASACVCAPLYCAYPSIFCLRGNSACVR